MKGTTVSNAIELNKASSTERSVENDVLHLGDAVQSGLYSSLVGDDEETRLAVFDATNESIPLNENLGKTIQLKDVIVEVVEMENETTGEIETQPRIILLDADGTAYHAISKPMLSTVKRLFAAIGQPHQWSGPKAVQIVEERSRAGRRFFKIVRVKGADADTVTVKESTSKAKA